MSHCSLLFRLCFVSARSQMQYRLSFFLLTLSYFFSTLMELLILWFLFDRFHMIGTWSMTQVALIYGMIQMAFSLAESFGKGFDKFSLLVKSGEFDRYLLRPRSPLLLIAGRELQLMRLGRFVQGFCVFTWAIQSLGLAHNNALLFYFGLCVLGGTCLFLGLFIFQATLSFWTVEGLEIMNILTHGGVEAGQYPLFIYRKWMRVFFTFVVPLGLIAYFPVSFSLHHEYSQLAYLCPLAGFSFLLLSLKVWGFGVRRYCSTGS